MCLYLHAVTVTLLIRIKLELRLYITFVWIVRIDLLFSAARFYYRIHRIYFYKEYQVRIMNIVFWVLHLHCIYIYKWNYLHTHTQKINFPPVPTKWIIKGEDRESAWWIGLNYGLCVEFDKWMSDIQILKLNFHRVSQKRLVAECSCLLF